MKKPKKKERRLSTIVSASLKNELLERLLREEKKGILNRSAIISVALDEYLTRMNKPPSIIPKVQHTGNTI